MFVIKKDSLYWDGCGWDTLDNAKTFTSAKEARALADNLRGYVYRLRNDGSVFPMAYT